MKRKHEAEPWETASLEWIHSVRRKEQAARRGRALRPLSRQAAEELAERYGLKLGSRVGDRTLSTPKSAAN